MRFSFRPPRAGRDWGALLLGAALAIPAAYQLAMGIWSMTWPTTKGTVTYSRAKSGYRRYSIDIRYRYQYKGREYDGGRYSFESFLNTNRKRSRDVDLIQARHAVGQPVQVAVSPSDPSVSVLQAGPQFEDLFLLGPGLLIMLVGVADPKRPEQPVRRKRIWAKVFGVSGLVLLIWGGYVVQTGQKSLEWPTTTGNILYARRTALAFEYFVDNTRYVGSNYRNYGQAFRSDEVTGKRFPKGSAVKVWYDPSDPAQSMLVPGVWFGNYLLVGFGLILLLIAWVAKKFNELADRAKGRWPPPAIH
jgi:hypothetical protein